MRSSYLQAIEKAHENLHGDPAAKLREAGLVVVPRVGILRAGAEQGYEWYQEGTDVTVFVVSVPRRPQIMQRRPDGPWVYSEASDGEAMFKVIELLFQAAAERVDCLVFPFLGCMRGCQNPAAEVGYMLRQHAKETPTGKRGRLVPEIVVAHDCTVVSAAEGKNFTEPTEHFSPLEVPVEDPEIVFVRRSSVYDGKFAAK